MKEFEARGRDDRHPFRFIVSAEDAVQLEDLHGFTRDLMKHMEADLGARLDWVAVDHWDTDNPHTHVVLRGKDEIARDLVIARDYIGHGAARFGAGDQHKPGRWRLRPDAEQTLRASAERGDIVRTMQRAFAAEPRERVILDPRTTTRSVVGRVAAKVSPTSCTIGRTSLSTVSMAALTMLRSRSVRTWRKLRSAAFVEVRDAGDRPADRN